MTIAQECIGPKSAAFCAEVEQSNLSVVEKEYLLSDLRSSYSDFPDFEYAKEWNEEIELEPVETYHRGVIRNAWVRIGAVDPSVKLGNELLVAERGTLVYGYDYNIQLPTGTQAGDCQTRYELFSQSGEITLLANGNRIDNNYQLDLQDSTGIRFEAVNTIRAVTRITHDTWQRPCARCAHVCRVSRVEMKVDSLTVRDEVNVIMHRPVLNPTFSVQESYSDTQRGSLFLGNFSSLNLNFDTSSLELHNYRFTESLTPAGTIQITAKPYYQQEENRLQFSNNIVTLPASQRCSIQISSFFQRKDVSCDVLGGLGAFTVKTDKLRYEPNETIRLSIEPHNRFYDVEYNGQRYITNTDLEFPATSPRITVTSGSQTSYALVSIENNQPFMIMATLGVFLLANYLFIAYVQKKWRAMDG